MKDIRAVRFNEKVRRVSALLNGGALVQLLTAFNRWGEGKGAIATSAWILAAVAFMFMAVQINNLLVLEDSE
ncbi:hypothetical protein KFK14_18065 [Sphingobium phenoxybenzoativorans]|uniref:Uncharacterized protein n=1 Tax=Sphingobium phenoxybenzoativorans TaxID=1592790 RepID=A0A975K4Y7_9SPHN|nr:hypothetical protein [Sphingobium phenoxybenzoativorans]QUT04910.1 hypothetical protein KFK14_18065 [Sphingobium phenoxybenzoativorans]